MEADYEPLHTPGPEIHLSIAYEITDRNIRHALRVIEHDIQDRGWALIGAEIERNCQGDGDFTFTLGLHKRGLPEIITHGTCGCSDETVNTIARRQLKAGKFDDGQITQIHDTTIRLARWPHTAHLRLLNEYYRHYSNVPALLMVSPL